MKNDARIASLVASGIAKEPRSAKLDGAEMKAPELAPEPSFVSMSEPMRPARRTKNSAGPFASAVPIDQHIGVASQLPQPRPRGPVIQTHDPTHPPDFRDLPWWYRQPAVQNQPLRSFGLLPDLGSMSVPRRLFENGTGQGVDPMRMVGAWLDPLDCVAVTYASWDPGGAAYVWSELISTNPNRGDFGHRIGTGIQVGAQSYDVRGFSATSVETPSGHVDGVFTYVDPNDRGTVHVFSIDGLDGSWRGTTVAQGLSAARPILPTSPVVCAGRFAGEVRTMLAFASLGAASDGRDLTVVNVGLLERRDGRWQFRQTASFPAYIPFATNRLDSAPKFNFAAAFDSNREAWLLGWCQDSGDGVRLARVDGDGATTIVSYADFSGEHISANGLFLSFNPRTNRFLLQAEHDLNFASMDGSFAPVPAFQGGTTRMNAGGLWATTTDYDPHFEFVVGAQASQVACESGVICESGLAACRDLLGGASARVCLRGDGLTTQSPLVQRRLRDLAELHTPDGPLGEPDYNWIVTAPLLARDVVAPSGVAMQSFVRAPRHGLVVGLFTQFNDRARGEARYTFIPGSDRYDLYGRQYRFYPPGGP